MTEAKAIKLINKFNKAESAVFAAKRKMEAANAELIEALQSFELHNANHPVIDHHILNTEGRR